MLNPIEQRLQSLRAEHEKGLQALADLESRQRQLRDTLLRISGAIQVLEELLQATPTETPPTP